MNISLTDDLKAAVDEQVERRGYMSTSEYIRELVRKDLQLAHVRDLLLEGAQSGPGIPADEVLADLRARIDEHDGA